MGGGGGGGYLGGLGGYSATSSGESASGQDGTASLAYGGLLVIICKGNLTIGATGVLRCNGLNGANGGHGEIMAEETMYMVLVAAAGLLAVAVELWL